MEYNIWFNLCAFFVLGALLVVHYTKFNAPFRKYSIFLLLVWLAMISTVSSICNNTLPGIAPRWILRTSNTIYFVAHSLILPVLILYVYSLTDYSLRSWQRLMPWLIPSAFALLLVLTSWYTDTLFWLDDGGVYHRGPMMPLLYLITAFNFLGVVFNLVHYWRLIPVRERLSMVLFLFISAGAVLIQLVYPWLLVENFASAMCMMISQLTVQNPEQIMDSSGMLNKQGFSTLVTPQFELGSPFQVGFLLVDNYHELEKAYGYQRLEDHLQVLSRFLQNHAGCVYARMDHRLFCFVPESFHSAGAWTGLMRALEEEALAAYLRREGVGIRFQLKTGMMNCPHDAKTFDEMMELIDAAAQLPMDKSRQVTNLAAADVMRLRRRKRIAELVCSAVRDESLSLVYQPVYCTRDKRFCSAEALLRMHTEELGNVSPGEFIEIAEENGAIVQLTQFVVENVCRFIQEAKLKELQLSRIHINLSAIDCAQGDLSSRILDAARRYDVDPAMLSTEITETAFSSMPDSILSSLTDLSRAGMTIMLDDYGTGYSNLNRLYSMPLDVVKLDKSLVDGLRTSESARIIMENTIQMMKRLNKRVLAEGVETGEQAEYLIEHGINYIQGYYYAKPMDGARLVELFRNQLKESQTEDCCPKG